MSKVIAVQCCPTCQRRRYEDPDGTKRLRSPKNPSREVCMFCRVWAGQIYLSDYNAPHAEPSTP